MTFVAAVIMQLEAVLLLGQGNFPFCDFSHFEIGFLTQSFAFRSRIRQSTKHHRQNSFSKQFRAVKQSWAHERWTTEGQKLEWFFDNNFPVPVEQRFCCFWT